MIYQSSTVLPNENYMKSVPEERAAIANAMIERAWEFPTSKKRPSGHCSPSSEAWIILKKKRICVQLSGNGITSRLTLFASGTIIKFGAL